MDKYLHQQGFIKGSTDSNLYIKVDNDKSLILVVYVDDIIFGRNEEDMSQNFALVMHFSITNQISQADHEEIWDGGFETSMYPYGDKMNPQCK